MMIYNQLSAYCNDKIKDRDLFPSLNVLNHSGLFKENVSAGNFESNKTKFINELEFISNKYGFRYITSDIVYDGDIPEHIFQISSQHKSNSDNEDIYYDKIINHMEHYCKIHKMFDLFEDSYIILK